MNGSVHIATGVTFMTILTARYATGMDVSGMHVIPAIGIATAVIGAKIPDLDLKPSQWGRGKKPRIVKAVQKTAGHIANKAIDGHRGVFHYPLWPALTYALALFESKSLSMLGAFSTLITSLLFGLVVGWGLHLFADMFNGKGIPILGPISKSKVHILDLPSEGFVPWLWWFMFTAISIFIFFKEEILCLIH